MHLYETTFVINPQTDDASIDRRVADVANLVTGHGGKVLSENRMGTRRLAYQIRGLTQGYYTSLIFEGPADVLPILDRQYRLEEPYIRWMTILYEGPDPREKEAEPEEAPKPRPRRREQRGSGRREGPPVAAAPAEEVPAPVPMTPQAQPEADKEPGTADVQPEAKSETLPATEQAGTPPEAEKEPGTADVQPEAKSETLPATEQVGTPEEEPKKAAPVAADETEIADQDREEPADADDPTEEEL